MNRLQIIVSIGLFLTLILLGWKSYMSQSNDGIKSDVRGMPESVRGEYEKQRAAKKAAAEEQAKAKAKAKVEANAAPATAKEGGVQEAPTKKVIDDQPATK